MPRKKKDIPEVAMVNASHEVESGGIIDESSTTEQSIWRRLSRWSFIIGVVLMPFFFIPTASGLASVTQQTVGGVAIIASLIFFLFDGLREKRIPFSSLPFWFKIFSFIFFLGTSISLFFSSSWIVNFWGGNNFEGGTGLTLLAGLLYFLMGASLFREKKDFRFLLRGVFLSLIFVYLSGILINFFLLFLGNPLFGVTSNAFNLLGGINAFALFSGGVCLLLLGKVLSYELTLTRKSLVAVFALLSFGFLLLFGNAVVFIISIVSFLLLLGLHQGFFSRDGSRFSAETALVIFIIAILSFFAITGYRVGSLLNLPAEVAPSFNASFSIAIQALSKDARSLLIGSGPNTYVSDFALFKPISINLTPLWNVDFPSAFSFWLTLLPTLGVVATLALLFLCLAVLLRSLRRLIASSKEGSFLKSEFLLFLGVVFLFANSFFFSLTFPLVVYLFVGLGLLAGLSVAVDETQKTSSTVTSSRSFLLTLILTLLIVLSIILSFFVLQRFYAFFVINRSVAVFNVDNNLQKVLEDVSVAHRIFPHETTAQLLSTLWRRSLVLSLNESSSSLASVTPQDSFNFSVSSVQEAISLNPQNHQNWVLLGDIYENVLSVEGALDQALMAYTEAKRVHPTNPLYPLVLARLQVLSADQATGTIRASLLASAEKNLQESLRLKPNMAESNALLGQLYYSEERFDEAELFFTQALVVNPGFSDARYLLALLYKKQGKLEEARENFNEVLRLNPGNEEVINQLDSLEDSRK